MNYLGLDLGEKRVGVALAESEMRLATPLKTLFFSGRSQLVAHLKELVAEYRPLEIVVGLPKTLSGEEGIAAQKVIQLVDWIKTQIPGEWVYWDERLTTAEAERVLLAADVSRMRRREVRDQIAAQRILQTYLDFQKNRR